MRAELRHVTRRTRIHATIVGALAALATLLTPAIAGAAGLGSASGTLYWVDSGSGAPALVRAGSVSEGTQRTIYKEEEGSGIEGLALDPASGQIFWVDRETDKIEVGNLNGEGSPRTLYAAPEVNKPSGLTVDPSTGKLYWTQRSTGQIEAASITGEGSPTTLYTEPAGSEPVAIAVAPATGRLYWSEVGSNEIDVGAVGGEGEAPASTLYSSASGVDYPGGMAIDSASGKLYWTNNKDGKVMVGSIAGSNVAGAKPLYTEPESAGIWGLALNPIEGRLYWADYTTDEIRTALISGEEAGAASTIFGKQQGQVHDLALLVPPGASAPPLASGADAAGEKLSCSTGTWASDMPEASFYEAPASLSYQWLLDGSPVPAASASTFIPSIGGAYSCEVSAANEAGATLQGSAAVSILAPPPTATISAPASGGAYTQGEVVATSFSCAEGAGGPGLASCDDQYGADTVSGGSGHLDTSTVGPHVYVVEAISKDGRRSGAVIDYEVIPRAIPAAVPGLRIAAGRAFVASGRAKVKLACAGTARCFGKLILKARVKTLAGKGRHPRVRFRTLVLGRAHYTLAPGSSRLVAVKLTRPALALLLRAPHLRVMALAIVTLHGGPGVHRKVALAMRSPSRPVHRKGKKRNGGRQG